MQITLNCNVKIQMSDRFGLREGRPSASASEGIAFVSEILR